MAYQLSPGVTWSEIDLTTVVPSVATTEGGFAGEFSWGPVNEIRAISSETELSRYFHKPNDTNFKSWFTAANFLAYGSNLKLIRSANNTSLNSTSGNAGLLIKTRDQYEDEYLDLSAANNYGMFAARYPGDLGNSIKVSVWANTVNTSGFNAWEYGEEFNGIPGTSNFASRKGASRDEMHLIVVDRFGNISGTPNTVLEKFSYVSKASDAKNSDGTSNYYVNVINDRSDYIYILNHAQNTVNHIANTTTWGHIANSGMIFDEGHEYYTSQLANGSIVSPTDGDLMKSYDIFNNTEEVDVPLLITGAASQDVSEYIVNYIAEVRKDSVVFISPLMTDAVNNDGQEATDIISYRNDFNSSTYAFMDSGWKKMYDKYNDTYRWVPLNGDIAGLCARTDLDRDPWWSPAGLNRGLIKGVTKLAWNPSKANRDELYKNSINPVVNFRGEGVLLYGDKTMTAKPSAFDRINVRRLFIVLEKAISRAAKYSLFEFNDEFTRSQFIALVEPYLRDVKGRRGIYDFKVVCDESNNTPEIIDRNEFVGDIYIKPARAINFIHLNFVAVRTGVAFSEIVGQF